MGKNTCFLILAALFGGLPIAASCLAGCQQQRPVDHNSTEASEFQQEASGAESAAPASSNGGDEWMCDKLPCNQGDLHPTAPPEGTEQHRNPIPLGPDTKAPPPPDERRRSR